ncbi:MAG: hexitol phosphatase HxpB [Bacteroidia bacterium]|jgi:sugar-phosphatase
MAIAFDKIEAVIFDMDGLLVDSEPYWKIAEKEVFGELGLELSDAMLRQVMGFRLSEVVRHWFHFQPWPNPDFLMTEKLILETMIDLIANSATALPGVYDTLEFCKSQGKKMALASSSAIELIEAVVDKLNIRTYFDVLWSANYEPFGKPHPGIFLTTAEKLQADPKHCLVLEDSINGVIAAKAARMHCLAVPEEATYNDPRFAIADAKVHSLQMFNSILQIQA